MPKTKRPPYEALLDRPLDLLCWRGALVVDGDWVTDGRVMFSLCHVTGPYIRRAEDLSLIKAQDDRIRSQSEADRLMEATESATMYPAVELGWRRERVCDKSSMVLDIMYVMRGGMRVPLLADYVRLLKSFVDYDEIRVSKRIDRPVGFYRRHELVAVCTPLAIGPR